MKEPVSLNRGDGFEERINPFKGRPLIGGNLVLDSTRRLLQASGKSYLAVHCLRGSSNNHVVTQQDRQQKGNEGEGFS